MLPDQSMRLHGPVGIDLRHVHIVYEINKFLSARGTEVSPGFLLQRLLHNLLQHERISVVVQRNGGDKVFIFVQSVQLVVDQDSLATAGVAYQHDRATVRHQQVQEVAVADSFSVVDQYSLERRRGGGGGGEIWRYRLVRVG